MSYHEHYRMLRRRWLLVSAFLMFLSFVLGLAVAHAATLPYDIYFVKSPRTGGDTATSPLPDVSRPIHLPPGSDLMLLPSNSATPRTLFAAGKGAVLDANMYYTGTHYLFAYCEDMIDLNGQRSNLPRKGCSAWRVDADGTNAREILSWKTIWKPLEGYGAKWSTRPDIADPPGSVHLGYGVYISGMLPLISGPNGEDNFLFTANREGSDCIKKQGGTDVCFNMYRYDGYHQTVECVWCSPGSVLHPIALSNGEIGFSMKGGQGPYDERPWGFMSMRPDGSDAKPRFSATMDSLHATHFCTGLADDSIVCERYYLSFNILGALYKIPLMPGANLNKPGFWGPSAKDNPAIPMGANRNWRHSYTPVGMAAWTPWTHAFDEASPLLAGKHVGKVGHPWFAPGGDILATYSEGPVQSGKTPRLHARIVVIPGGVQTDGPEDVITVLADTTANLIYPKYAGPWKTVFGGDYPPFKDPVGNNGSLSKYLPPGTPFGITGTAAVIGSRESKAGQSQPGWQGQQTTYGGDELAESNFDRQGGDTKPFKEDEVYSLEIVVQGQVPHLSYNDPDAGLWTRAFRNGGGGNNDVNNEYLKSLAPEITLLKQDASGKVILAPWGEPDSSFKAVIPAGVPYTFRLRDKYRRVVSHSFFWHPPLLSGEVRDDCGGCHYHAHEARSIAQTVAGQADYVPWDLTKAYWPMSEGKADILPIFKDHCASCHTGATPPANLDLDDPVVMKGVTPRNLAVFTANQTGSMGGVKPIFRLSNTMASRAMMPFNCLRSVLCWIAYFTPGSTIDSGRLDGFTNASFAYEALPGDKTTLPPGTTHRNSNIALYPGVLVAHKALKLTDAQRYAISNWIDNGGPVDLSDNPKRQWKTADVWRPTISWFDDKTAATMPGCPCPVPGGKLIFGAYDVGSGLNLATLTATRDGQAVTPVAIAGSRWELPRVPGMYQVKVSDSAGNTQELRRRVP